MLVDKGDDIKQKEHLKPMINEVKTMKHEVQTV